MRTKLLFIAFLTVFSLSAQTTFDLDWAIGSGTNNDLTIISGDTVRWTWTTASHTVENTPGSSVETFDSGFIGPIGSTFEYTFTIVGDNNYFCGVHGAASMSGTITVNEDLGIPEERLNTFSILPNPASTQITIKLPSNPIASEIEIFNILGKRILTRSLNNTIDTQISISDWQSGLYVIRIKSGDNSQIKRFIKL